MSLSPTAETVATWMLSQVQTRGALLQFDAALYISREFGEEFIFRNGDGELLVAGYVIVAFAELTHDRIVWSHSGQYWRPRAAADLPGRAQR